VRIHTIVVTAAALASLVLAPAAAAHVTLNPDEGAAEDFGRFDIRVPTERDVDTTSVSVKLPEGLFFVSFQPKPGWKREVKMAKLDKPVELFGDKVTERVDTVTWSGGRIAPGEFDEFGMSARLPNRAGAELVFPATQTYASGEVVRWIGPPDAEQPAPRVKLTAAAAEEQPAPAPAGGEPQQRVTVEEEGSTTLEVIALVLGAAGLVAGLAALLAVRSRRTGRELTRHTGAV
jgi:periplasmic copper chaperone A